MFDYHEPDDASSDDGMKNNKRLQQPIGPASQKFDFDKISEIGKIRIPKLRDEIRKWELSEFTFTIHH